VVNMANCANVTMRLGSVKLFFGHMLFALFANWRANGFVLRGPYCFILE